MDSQKNKATDLIRLAYEAQKRSYSPYSGFQTGAALETAGGKVYQGCNIENAAYSPTNCAERTAIFKAVSEGCRGFLAISIASDAQQPTAPCGVCRQVLAEFCSPDFVVLMSDRDGRYDKKTLGDLLPEAFGSSFLSTGTDL